MSAITSGTYVIVNGQAGNAIDLSGGDHKSIIGFNVHKGTNQQWKVQSVGEYVTIQSVGSGQYLSIEGQPQDGTPVLATQEQVRWVIKHDDEDPGVFRIFLAGTGLNIDLADHGNPTPGTPIQLWGAWNGRNQTWKFEPV